MGNCCGGRGLGKSLYLEELNKATYIEHNSQRSSFRPNKLNLPQIQEESKDYISVDSGFRDSAHVQSKSALSPSKFKKRLSTFTDLYQVVSILYRGVRYIVEEIQHLSSGLMLQAFYFLSCNKQEQEVIRERLQRLCEIEHPHLLKVHDFFIQGSTVIIVTDRYQGTSLLQNSLTATGFTSKNLSSITRQILAALMYLHNQGISFLDFTPSCVSLVPSQEEILVKLVTLMNQALFRSPRVRAWFSELQRIYKPPIESPKKVVQPKGKQDVYALGALLYLTVSGEYPSESDLVKYESSFQLNRSITPLAGVDAKLVDLILKMLDQDPQQRLDINQCLHHPWIIKSLSSLEVEELSMHSFLKLKSKLRAQRIHHAIITYISNVFEIEERADALGQIFLKQDGQAAGTLLKSQFEKSFVALGMSELYAKQIVKKIFLDNKFNQNKQINFSEFLDSYAQELQNLSNEELLKVLQEYDRDGTGQIDSDIVRSIVIELHQPKSSVLKKIREDLQNLLQNYAGDSVSEQNEKQIKIADLVAELKQVKLDVRKNTEKHLDTQELIMERRSEDQ